MNESTPQRIVVMTGATAGLGAHAVQLIAAQPDTLVIVGARGSGGAVPEGCVTIPLDLASLDSVRVFAEAVKLRLADARINMLVLNAGAQYPNADQRSADGFETTFAVNHLAHYLLARLLLPNLAEDARLVFTTSDTHDPAVIQLAPKTLDTQLLAHPGKGSLGAGMRAYAASKLCNLLTARSFAALDVAKARRIQVVAYNPGFAADTALMRAASGPTRTMVRMLTSGPLGHLVFGIVGKFNSAFYLGTSQRAGEVLAQLTLGTVVRPSGRIYVSLVRGEITFPDPSELARSDEARDRLWRDSAAMVGIMD